MRRCYPRQRRSGDIRRGQKEAWTGEREDGGSEKGRERKRQAQQVAAAASVAAELRLQSPLESQASPLPLTHTSTHTREDGTHPKPRPSQTAAPLPWAGPSRAPPAAAPCQSVSWHRQSHCWGRAAGSPSTGSTRCGTSASCQWCRRGRYAWRRGPRCRRWRRGRWCTCAHPRQHCCAPASAVRTGGPRRPPKLKTTTADQAGHRPDRGAKHATAKMDEDQNSGHKDSDSCIAVTRKAIRPHARGGPRHGGKHAEQANNKNGDDRLSELWQANRASQTWFSSVKQLAAPCSTREI